MTEPVTHKSGEGVGGGRFLLVRPLGRGGMGEVWLARDQRLEEQVALKFLPPEWSQTPATAEHLRREVARSHKLSHPNIIRLHDLHEPPGETAFISMEYVDGPSLGALRADHTNHVMKWDYLRAPVTQLCAALAYAHAENVIHRDLKPQNLLIDSRGRLRLTDFGVAAVASDMARLAGLKGGGTLEYMSPQQVEGKHPQPTDDIYSLGVALYELLTGRLPFHGEDARDRILHAQPEPLNQVLAKASISDSAPHVVEETIMRCLSKNSEDRPQTAAEVAASLELSGTKTAPAPNHAAAQAAEPPPNPKPIRFRAAVAMCILLAAASCMLFLYSHRKANNRDAKLAGRTETENPKQVVAQPADSTPQTIPGTPSLAVASNPPPTPVVIGPKPPYPMATRWTNSLGMIFVPIPGSEAMFCIWITRVQDYQVMAVATARPWEKTSFAQGPTHPAVNISWEDAMEFCSWLTRRERGMDWIRSNQIYRLPTDIEWSLAVGLGHEKGKTPKDKDNKTPGIYPWGRQWPPPRGVGNFDPSLNVDDYIYTSPVGAFPPNPFGLYDMAGNAREWCEDLFDPGASRRRVVRGSSWFDTPQKTLESSRRCLTTTERHNDTRPDYFGFRCVLVTGSIRAAIPR